MHKISYSYFTQTYINIHEWFRYRASNFLFKILSFQVAVVTKVKPKHFFNALQCSQSLYLEKFTSKNVRKKIIERKLLKISYSSSECKFHTLKQS